jgi:hypothetical protein
MKRARDIDGHRNYFERMKLWTFAGNIEFSFL